ncbi:MAG: hypothetical protein AAGA30_01690 [Planctomycetota bacterium]
MTNGSKSKSIRQFVLVGILIVVLAAFLYDKYVLIPSADKKINQIATEVSMKLSPENRKQVHEIVGISPASKFEHNGVEVEQYRFPRGLPFFPRPVLDIAYDGDTMIFFRQEPMDEAYIDAQKPKTKIDRSLAADPGEIQVLRNGGPPPKKKVTESKTAKESDKVSDDPESSDE